MSEEEFKKRDFTDVAYVSSYTKDSRGRQIEYVRKDAFIEKVCNWLEKNATYTHPRKGVETCMVNLTYLKEYLEEEV